MKLPHDLGPIHFVGIGGIGMSGVAEALVDLGYKVQGSDTADNSNVKRLRDKGVTVFGGQDPRNIEGVAVVVVSSAIKGDNVEVVAARATRVPSGRRAGGAGRQAGRLIQRLSTTRRLRRPHAALFGSSTSTRRQAARACSYNALRSPEWWSA